MGKIENLKEEEMKVLIKSLIFFIGDEEMYISDTETRIAKELVAKLEEEKEYD